MIKLLFFAQLAEYAQTSSTQVEFHEACTARTLVESLQGQMPDALTNALLHDAVLVAANEVMITWDDKIQDGDELAFLPPFSGG